MKVILGKLNNELLINLASRAAPFCTQVEAAVAYAESADHPLLRTCKERNLRLAFYGLLDEQGAVSLPLLRELMSWGPSRAQVRLVYGNFHPKVIWWRGFGAYLGSANLTNKGWFQNIEAGVFIDEAELQTTELGAELEDLFEHLAKPTVSFPVTKEIIAKLEQLSSRQQAISKEQKALRDKFEDLFKNLPKNRGLAELPPKGEKENKRLKRFAAEWTQTLELMRGTAEEFQAFDMRPSWVDPDAHPAIHFDQFLHAYYYDYVRGGVDLEEETEASGIEKVKASFERNRANPGAALKKAARWWSQLPSDRYGEEHFIRTTGPTIRMQLTKDAVAAMDVSSFTEALRNVNAFRMHARQVKNEVFGLPNGHHETIDKRVERLCAWLWQQRSLGGRSVREVLEFVLWGTTPSDMEERLWLAVYGDEYRLPHFGQSSLGEAVGWARPDDFPPRNNRTNKALQALGHEIKLFST